MADSSLSVPSVETENFTRLSMLVINGGTKCLKGVLIEETFHRLLLDQKQRIREEYVPNNLHENQFEALFPEGSKPFLNLLDHTLLVFVATEVFHIPSVQKDVSESHVRKQLKNYLKCDGLSIILNRTNGKLKQVNAEHNLIGKTQWDTIFPDDGSIVIEAFDISLLCFIIFNAFDLQPSSGLYTAIPAHDQITRADDILRLKLYRGELAHRNSINIETSRFESMWKGASESLERLGGDRYRNFAMELKDNPVDKILTEHFQCIIQQYHAKEADLKGDIAEIKEKLENLIILLETSARQNPTEKSYLIKVRTGEKTGAGTDANVYLTIHGTKGRSSERKLSKSYTNRNKFERNKTDEFRLRMDMDIGEIFKITVRHDNSGTGAAWYLDWITIETPETDTSPLMFVCEKWLAKDLDDNVISRTLLVKGFKEKETNPQSVPRKQLSREESVILQEHLDHDTIPITVQIAYGFKTDGFKTDGFKPDELSWKDTWFSIQGTSQVTDPIYLNNLYRDTHEQRYIATFCTSIADPGNVREIRIGHGEDLDQVEIYLKSLMIEFPTKGKSWDFLCNSWLGGERTTAGIPLRFQVQGAVIEYTPKAKYDIKITTADIQDAGTDTNIYLTLFGLQGKTSAYNLRKDMHRFERGTTDHFQLVLEDVGFLRKIRIETDGTGSRPTWHPEKIEVRNVSMPTATFVVKKWFSKEDKLVRDLSPMYDDRKALISATTYKISVRTSDVKGAGTDANVYIVMFGTNGDSGTIPLKKSGTNKDPFERNKTDEFIVSEILGLGDLCKVRVWHDDKGFGAAWHLYNIEVQDTNTKKQYTFHCHKWLSFSDDDKQICRELTCGKPDIQMNQELPVFYEVEVELETTNQSSELQLGLKLEGKQESYTTSATISTPQLIGRKMVQISLPVAIPLWSITRITIMANMSWIMKNSNITITDGSTGDRVTLKSSASEGVFVQFSFQKSLMSIVQGLQTVKYDITVQTGTTHCAGTDANVYITLYGINGDTGKRPLKKKRRDLFEKGRKDQFIIEALDLGDLEKIRIAHDASGIASGWFLDKIVVKHTASGETTEFPYYGWLKKTSNEKLVSKDLIPLIRSLLRE